MERSATLPLFLILVLHGTCISFSLARKFSIGVNYGTWGNNLPPPADVAKFLIEKTKINQVKIFDCNPDILRAFANTNVSLSVTIPNGEIPYLTLLPYARQWIRHNIAPFYPQTKIKHILVGNEILFTLDDTFITRLVPAMRSVRTVLDQSGMGNVHVSSPHALNILLPSNPPSAGQFRPGWDTGILAPMLQFLRETKSPFMVNPYPLYGYDPNNVNYALFKPNPGKVDQVTGKKYTNLFDEQMDMVYSAMKKLGYQDVNIVVTETGWPSAGEPDQPFNTLQNAQSYNGGLIQHVTKKQGTPLMPNRKFETYIFALFNENTKPGGNSERNFGLFHPDFTPVYDVGIMRNGGGQTPGGPTPVTPSPGGNWCVAKDGASDQALQASLNWACGNGADCSAIQPGASCFNPNTIKAHASYAMNSYYKKNGGNGDSCNFSNTATITTTDPSSGSCKY